MVSGQFEGPRATYHVNPSFALSSHIKLITKSWLLAWVFLLDLSSPSWELSGCVVVVLNVCHLIGIAFALHWTVDLYFMASLWMPKSDVLQKNKSRVHHWVLALLAACNISVQKTTRRLAFAVRWSGRINLFPSPPNITESFQTPINLPSGLIPLTPSEMKNLGLKKLRGWQNMSSGYAPPNQKLNFFWLSRILLGLPVCAN